MSISLNNVTKRFSGQAVVDRVSLDIDDEEFFVFLGPSGCGKTTLMRLIAGLDVPDEGSVLLDGRIVFEGGRSTPPEERGVGVVFQSYALWPHMSVEQNVAFPVETHLNGRELRDHVLACLSSVELDAFAQRKPVTLSGGQRQRVALARCLSQRAGTILMDEPLANLDPHLRHAMEDELVRFHRQTGATTLYITHDQREAMALAHRIAVMWEGRLLQVGPPEEIYHQPMSAEVASFVGRSALLSGRVVSSQNGRAVFEIASAGETEARCSANTQKGPAELVVRPEDVTVEESEQAVEGRVESATYRGDHWECRIATLGSGAAVLARTAHRLEAGVTVPLTIREAWILPNMPGY
ncbi:MAG: ABC transporter ATP-binding protein [Pseudomonadota bacterium]